LDLFPPDELEYFASVFQGKKKTLSECVAKARSAFKLKLELQASSLKFCRNYMRRHQWMLVDWWQ